MPRARSRLRSTLATCAWSSRARARRSRGCGSWTCASHRIRVGRCRPDVARSLSSPSTLAAAATAAPAAAQVQLPAKPQTASLDSDAPPGAPPHWLPNERWVMQHWLPYDEQRLYSLLGVDRGVIWRQLRDDTRNLAQLAEQRGWEPRALARELVGALAERAARSGPPGAAREARAAHADPGPPRAAHLLPLVAPGGDPVPRDGDLRRRQPRRVVDAAALGAQPAADLPAQRPAARPRPGAGGGDAARVRRQGRRPPVDPARPGGAAAARASCASSRAGCSRRATTARRRSSRRAPRPPPRRTTPTTRRSPATAGASCSRATRPSSRSPSASARSRCWRARSAPARRPCSPSGQSPDPRSNYNPALSADGRWVAFESALGNLNFAKRYGRMEVLARDLRSGAHDQGQPPARPRRSRARPTTRRSPATGG